MLSSFNEAFWQGIAQGAAGMGGYGMGGYQVMPSGFVRDTSMDYLLDPRYAMQQVQNQEQQEYEAAKQFRPNLTLEQYRAEKAQAYQIMKEQERGSSSSSSSSSSPSVTTNQQSKTACRSCMYTNGKCPVCKGSGRQSSSSYGVSTTIQCSNCKGSGRCPSCGGDGWIN